MHAPISVPSIHHISDSYIPAALHRYIQVFIKRMRPGLLGVGTFPWDRDALSCGKEQMESAGIWLLVGWVGQ